MARGRKEGRQVMTKARKAQIESRKKTNSLVLRREPGDFSEAKPKERIKTAEEIAAEEAYKRHRKLAEILERREVREETLEVWDR